MTRKTQAEVLLNTYSRELERRRLVAGSQGLLLSRQGKHKSLFTFRCTAYCVSSDGDFIDDDDDDDDEEEFHYPGSSPPENMHAASIRSYSTDYFGRTNSRTPTDLTPHLSQAPEFRVPTHEAPQKVLTPQYTPPTPHEVHARWERDERVSECRQCQRRFTFLLRRVRAKD